MSAVNTAVPGFVIMYVHVLKEALAWGKITFPKQTSGLKGIDTTPRYWFLFQGPLTAVAS